MTSTNAATFSAFFRRVRAKILFGETPETACVLVALKERLQQFVAILTARKAAAHMPR